MNNAAQTLPASNPWLVNRNQRDGQRNTNAKKNTKVIHMTNGAQDLGTLMDSTGSDRPQRRTALVGRELGRYKR